MPELVSSQVSRSRWSRMLVESIRTHPQLFVMIMLSLGAGCVLFGAVFFTRGYPGRDSGIFLYFGQQILAGSLPYRDLWDNKPPAIFYIDAFGLLVGGGSIVGVWLVELLSLWLSVLLSVKVLDRAFGLGAAFFGSAMWLVGLMLIFTVGGPNLQEEYAIPLKFAALWLFIECEQKGYRGWRGLLLGITGAAAFLLRQNLIGIHLAIGLSLVLTRSLRGDFRRLVRELSWILAGGILALVVVGAYFAANGALGDLLDVAFLYNLLYASTTLQKKLDSIFAGFNEFARSGLGVIGLASWIAGTAFVVTGQPLQNDARRVLRLALLAFPIEVVLSTLSGRSYGHYYQAWLPVIAVLAGFFANCLLSYSGSDGRAKVQLRTAIWQVALIAAAVMLPAYATIAGTLPVGKAPSPEAHAAAYVREFTQPGDYVLVWGADLSINFASHRKSPSRFAHQYPLYTRGYQTPQMVREFLADIQRNPPELIIDTSPVDGFIPPIDDSRRSSWKRWAPNDFYAPLPEMDEVFDYLKRNYKERGPLVQPEGAVFVYERRPTSQ